MQVTGEQLKGREISSKYICLQQSGECLTQIQRFNEKDLGHKPLELQSIDQRQLILTMVQSIYLLYMAQCTGTSFRISKRVNARHIQRGIHTVYVVFIIEDHFHALKHQHQQYVTRNFDIYEYANQAGILKQQFFRMIEVFQAKIYAYSQKYPEFLGKNYKQPYQEFTFFMTQFIKPNIKLLNDPRDLLECLEKTQLFKDNSLLLNIKMSLLYDKLRPFLQQGMLFAKFEEMQANFKKEFIKTITKTKRIELISLFLGSLLKQLINNNVISIAASIQGKKEKQKDMKTQQSAQIDRNQSLFKIKGEKIANKWQFYTKNEALILNPSNFMKFITAPDRQAFQRSNKTELKNKINSFLLEIDHGREIINIKIFCPLVVGMDNIDSLLYRIATIGEQWYYPSFQLVDVGNVYNSAQNHKKLALSVGFRMCPGKSTVARFLTLIDVLLVCQRSLLAELNKPPYKLSCPHRYNTSNEFIARMSLILLKNIQRVYQAQLTPQCDEKQ